MGKLKYPIKFQNQQEYINVPVFTENTWWCAKLEKDGTTTKSGFAGHLTEASCQICCTAHNKRIGCSDKDVKKLIREYHGQKESKGKKSKKGKKAKETKKVKKIKRKS